MLNRKLIRHVLVILAALTACFSLQAETITIKHIKGTTQLESQPKRVVVLGHGSLDTLDALGVEVVGTPHMLMPDYLSDYLESTTNTGSLFEPDFEVIFSLKPDLIIAEDRVAPLFNDLEKIAPTVMFDLENGNYWKDAQDNWRMIAKIFSKSEQVEAIINEIDQDFDSVHKQVDNNNLDALMVMNSGTNITMFNKGSRFSVLFDEFGFTESASQNIAPIKGPHGSLVSFEYIADAKPDVIFILDREHAIGKSDGKAKELFNNALVRLTPAHKNNKIVILNPDAWYLSGGGITATRNMIADIKNLTEK